MQSSDVLVVGKGNAALCAALAAREAGASVTMLEAASQEAAGGNSAFAGGVMRFAFDSVEDLKRITDLTAEEIAISYDTRAVALIYDGERVNGVRARRNGRFVEFAVRAVVLACGGFEANPKWRACYLGPGWELAKVRGTRFNVGDGLRLALDIG